MRRSEGAENALEGAILLGTSPSRKPGNLTANPDVIPKNVWQNQ